MASSALRTTAFLVALNLLFFTLVSSDTAPDATCPINGLNLGLCSNVLKYLLPGPPGSLVGTAPPTPPTLPCCGIFLGLADLEAATCFCRAFKANVFGVDVNAAVSLNLLLNHCGKGVPNGFQCAA